MKERGKWGKEMEKKRKIRKRRGIVRTVEQRDKKSEEEKEGVQAGC